MNPTRITFLGLGAMGARMAAQLIKAGHTVTVWNRTPAAAAPLLAAGAAWADSPRAAAVQAEVVMAMVRDDEAARQVWCDTQTGALAGMRAGALAIDSSTLTPAWTRAWAHRAAEAGVRALEAPVSGSRPAAELGRLVFLLGGEPSVVEAAKPVLACMGTVAHHVGSIGSGALAKLVTNALLGIHVTALAELKALLQHAGADVAKILQGVSATPVWAPVDHGLVGSMTAEDFRPQFPITLILKDFGYLQGQAQNDASIPLVKASQAVFQRAQAQGLGEANMTAVAHLYR